MSQLDQLGVIGCHKVAKDLGRNHRRRSIPAAQLQQAGVDYPSWVLRLYLQGANSVSPRVRDLAAQFRSRQVPCDVLYLDIHHMDGYRSFTWDPRRFPDPEGMVKELHDELGQSITAVKSLATAIARRS